MPERWGTQRWIKNEDGSYSKRYYDRSAEVVAELNITDAAAELAQELGVDVETLEGSGAGGRITKGDVEGAAAAK